jgi:hypothetical protein
MDKKRAKYHAVKRYVVAASRDCSMGVVSFDTFEWTEHTVRIVNLSVLGAGIHSNSRIEPGLVWFKERVGGYKCGVLKWSGEIGPPYGAGVEFLPLLRDVEEYLQKQIEQSRPDNIIPDPDQILKALIATMNKGKN